MRRSKSKVCLFILTILVLSSGAVMANRFEPVFNPTLEVTKTEQKIEIDGQIDSSEWANASHAQNFVEHNPGDQTRPPVDTRALITYDSERIYVAFVCEDDPSQIRSSMTERDNFYSDDMVSLLIDPYGTATWAYIFRVNPYGIQSDALWSANGGDDNSYDMVWESAAQITDSGYQVEISVPFSSLRFPSGNNQNWKVDFYRTHPRDTRREYSWAAYNRDQKCWPCQWGTVTGLNDVEPGKGIEIMPSVISYQSGQRVSRNEFKNDDINGELSVNAKYGITSEITAEVSYNPDFSQVESDAGQIDINSNFALFYPERRPFFQEGSDLYFSWIRAIYTRSINDPQAAGKVTGRAGNTNFIYLLARDEHSPMILPFEERSAFLLNGKSTSNILRLQQSLGGSSRAGLIVTDRRMDGGGSGSLVGFDGELMLTNSVYMQWELHGSYIVEPNDPKLTEHLDGIYFDEGRHTAAFDGESYAGHAALLAIGRGGADYWLDLTYYERSPTFRADNGFEPTNNYREVATITRYNFYPNKKLARRVGLNLLTSTRWNFDKELKSRFATFSVNGDFIAQTRSELSFRYGSEKYRGIQFNDIRDVRLDLGSNLSNRFGVNLFGMYGRSIARNFSTPVLGNQTYLIAGCYIKPIDRLRIEPSIRYIQSDAVETGEELYEGYITRARIELQASRQISLRFITEYDDFNSVWRIEPLLSYRVNPFSLFYIGTTYNYEEYRVDEDPAQDPSTLLSSRQFFMKFQYLFQI